MSDALWQSSGRQLQGKVAAGACTHAEIAAAYAARLAERESEVRAWSWCDPRQAMAQARLADASMATGTLAALSGFVIGIKDIIDTADMPTAYGAALYEGHRPTRDAALVTRLRQAGALIMGKTVTTEFAYAAPGPTRNPHAVAHTPGGSSSGSAAAVAAGMTTAAISSQTGGSTIRPAAFCGVVGFKPTYGRIDATGMKPLAPSSDTVGLHARTVDDVAMLFGVLAEQAHVVVPRRMAHIAWYPGPFAAQASAASHQMLARVRDRLQAAGIAVHALALAHDMVVRLGEENRLIMAVEAARSLAQEYRDHRAALTAPTIRLIEQGRAVADARYRAALGEVERGREVFTRAMSGIDALLTFSTHGRAPLASEGTGDSLFNRPWSALGVPCLSLPAGQEKGLPLGIQLIAAAGRDEMLLGGALDVGELLGQL